MNSRAIQKLKTKFIMVAMFSFIVVMVFTGGLINIANLISVRAQARRVLNYIVEHEGEIPDYEEIAIASQTETASGESSGEIPVVSSAGDHAGTSSTSADSARTSAESSSDAYSIAASMASSDWTAQEEEAAIESLPKEFRYSTRYFAVIFDEEDNVLKIESSHIASLDEEQIVAMAEDIIDNYWNFGEEDGFFYEVAQLDDERTIVVVLDSSQQIELNRSVIRSTVLICAAGLLITGFIVWLFSSRAIRPEIDNARRQKQFITNASHELKTPLAVIRANTELIELMNGESEWTQSTMRQVDRMNGLIQNLVMIARAEEQEDRSFLAEIDVTKVVKESVEPFRSLAQQDRKELSMNLAADVKMVANESKIRQLISILVDNAIKYCDDEGKIEIALDTLKKGKIVRIMISNSYAEGANVDYSKFFDRFYREDQAHNVDKGGYGIGLSMAESICKVYRGSIDASWKDGIITFTCLLASWE